MRKYDEEFKREALRKIFEGQPVSSVSRETGVSENQLHKWKKAAAGVEIRTDAEKELRALRKRNRELEMEVEILKKAALIFGRGG